MSYKKEENINKNDQIELKQELISFQYEDFQDEDKCEKLFQQMKQL